ncbi:hypothetical protein [Endozoicomonas ascidiicola]|uniref:hypothetical protein n=1 Tax=Endozoicomonas ascidiicola TaxID=1698521 RepID=UPI00082E1ACB|nr:hypothetical protein [Endozoicomonas ascidiicola]
MRYVLMLVTTILRISLLSLLDRLAAEQLALSKKERVKRGWVKSLWLCAGILMLFNPVLPVMLIIALPTTFLSFMILDELK